MAVITRNKVTTITPTAWKWGLGAVLMLPFAPLSWLVAPIFLLTACGVLQRIVLTPEGISVRNYWRNKSYRWQEIDDFRVSKVKSTFFTAASMVNFTHKDRRDTMLGKATKALTGGTDSLPAVGMKAQDLTQLMREYQRGDYPADTAVSAMPTGASRYVAEITAAMPEPDFSKPAKPQPKPRSAAPLPKPAMRTNRSKPKVAGSKSAISGNQAPLVQSGRSRLFNRKRRSHFG